MNYPWDNWDERQKLLAQRIAGLVLFVITVFIFVASISYLFSWREDMSLLGNPQAMSMDTSVDNIAGKAGFKTGHNLVSNLFGLGSFFLVLIFGALSLRLLLGRWRRSLIKTALVAVFGAVLTSITFGYIGKLIGLETIFGGGLGGRVGTIIVLWAENLVGTIILALIIIVLIIIFLLLTSGKFVLWIDSLGKKKTIETEEEITEDTGDIEDEDIPEEDFEDISEEDDSEEDDPEEDFEDITESDDEETEPGFDVVRDDSGVLDEEVTKELKPIDIRLDEPEGLPKYKFPSLDLLESYDYGRKEVSAQELLQNKNKITATLANYKIQISDIKALVGPTVTLYKVYPAPGVRISDIKRLHADIAVALNAKGVRVVILADSVGIEVANEVRSIVPLKNLLNSDIFRNTKFELPVAIGYTITQEVKVFDLTDAPHLLVAGATKQGKSVGLNVIINSLLYSKHPSELKFVFIDPKMVEFSSYNGLLKHYLAVLPDSTDEEEEKEKAIVKTVKDAEKVLRSLCIEMDERYKLMASAKVNKVDLYNEKYKQRKLRPDLGFRYLPYLVVVIDEYADLAASAGSSPEAKAKGKSIMVSIIRLAQKGRAAGLHVILATQRPSVNIISGDIKANFPMRIAFRTLSGIDSKTILDMPGAEKLVGKGDMLFYSGVEVDRLQCALIGPEEIDKINSFIESQTKHGACYNTPYYLPLPPEGDDSSSGSTGGYSGGNLSSSNIDERFKEAAEMVVLNQKGSTSDLQRRLGMGYAKAGRVMDQLESAGIVGPQEGSKPRQVIISSLDELEEIYRSLGI